MYMDYQKQHRNLKYLYKSVPFFQHKVFNLFDINKMK